MTKVRRCNHCLLPETYETIELANDDSSCNMCKDMTYKHTQIDWGKRKKMLDKVIEKYRGKYDYDCIIPFSGGKDSTFTLYYLVNEYKLKPLVVRFDQGFMREGIRKNNDQTMRKLGVDYLSFTPNWKIVKKLMWESFIRKTDFCWHCHAGIYTYPLRVALKYNIPLVFWGEPLAEMSAYYTYENDEIEWEDETKYNMLRNLGITADDMFGMINTDENPIDKRDLLPYTYPDFQELKKMDYYSVCLGSFIPWDYKENTKLIMKEIGWNVDELEGVPAEINQEGAKIECWMQGARDYIKYLKRGYGRVTQLVNFEIRNGRMTTQEGQNWIDKYEGRKPQSLDLFLQYMGIEEKEFNEIIKTFVVPPFEPNFEDLKNADLPHDFATWYKENNRK